MSNLSLSLRQCVSVFLYTSDGRFLLVKKNRPKHAWQLPQGGVESGESIEQALHREVKEELGFILGYVRSANKTHTYRWPMKIQSKRGFCGQCVHFFIASYPQGQEIIYNVDDPYEPQSSRLVSLAEARKIIDSNEYFFIIQELYAQASHT